MRIIPRSEQRELLGWDGGSKKRCAGAGVPCSMRVGSEGMSGQRCGGGEREKLLAQTQKGEKAGLAKEWF